LEVRIKTLKEKELSPFVDPKDPGALIPVEGAQIEQLAMLSDVLAKPLSPTRTEQFLEFRTASEAG
jgi:hypothetical protein